MHVSLIEISRNLFAAIIRPGDLEEEVKEGKAKISEQAIVITDLGKTIEA